LWSGWGSSRILSRDRGGRAAKGRRHPSRLDFRTRVGRTLRDARHWHLAGPVIWLGIFKTLRVARQSSQGSGHQTENTQTMGELVNHNAICLTYTITAAPRAWTRQEMYCIAYHTRSADTHHHHHHHKHIHTHTHARAHVRTHTHTHTHTHYEHNIRKAQTKPKL
jgi:hypothetical protein